MQPIDLEKGISSRVSLDCGQRILFKNRRLMYAEDAGARVGVYM
jgi:hypothetical protein